MTETTPTPQPLYKAQEPVFPRRVSGTFRTLKWWIMGITLGIYYLVPWIRWDRGPELPDQAVLVDLASRRFFFFWIEIWPHEFYFVAGLLIMAGLGLFLFTSVLGRVWCGYTCPQTVWTDLFILVERWIEGDRNARVRLWNAPWDARKVRLRVTKWLVWLGIAGATGGAWVYYFTDAPTLFWDLLYFRAHPVAYATIGVLTATTFVFGGFMREQVCIYMCPWPRIQAAMMDESSLTVAYRSWRGEPRGKPGVEGVGDCIDCKACVNVCPMGIDIRDGQQMECITCALCIDACDDVMVKLDRPKGLIGYLALEDEGREKLGMAPRSLVKHVFRPRTLLYTGIWAAFGFALVFALFIRPAIEFSVAPVRNPLFVVLSDGAVRNTYDLRLKNKHGEERIFQLSFTGARGVAMTLEGEPELTVRVPADATYLQRVYLTAAAGTADAAEERLDVRFWIEDVTSGERASVATVFNGRAAE
jgi:cytochrome c oxidase accessory protein FixG